MNLPKLITISSTVAMVEAMVTSVDVNDLKELLERHGPGGGPFLGNEEADFAASRMKLFAFYADQLANASSLH